MVQEDAYRLAGVIDNLVAANAALEAARLEVAALSPEHAALAHAGDSSAGAVSLISLMLVSDSAASLESLWEEFSVLDGLDAVAADLGLRVYEARALEFSALQRLAFLSAAMEEAGASLDSSVASLVDTATDSASSALVSSVAEFDQGRVLLFLVSVASVVGTTLTAWLWVGNRLVRPLSRLSERMRGMAAGDLETPVPGVGRDEVGELAHALEVFREQAYEVERLNLVEKLYGELQQANEELQRMQARLVAQEKLAALGELVSGVAHEISNPLNFVQNFSEGALELYEEFSELVENYRDGMKDEDRQTLADLQEEMTDSLTRIRSNGGRALAIVERMRSFGVAGGDVAWVELNADVRGAVEVALDSFKAMNPEFEVAVEYRLDPAVGEFELAEGDFGNSVVNLVSNACHAMLEKRNSLSDGYSPELVVSTSVTDEEVLVAFRDNGTGISEEALPRIFNPFFTTRDGILGAGLGLPIAADVVSRAGGSMTVDTVQGEFAEFTILLPRSGHRVSSGTEPAEADGEVPEGAPASG